MDQIKRDQFKKELEREIRAPNVLIWRQSMDEVTIKDKAGRLRHQIVNRSIRYGLIPFTTKNLGNNYLDYCLIAKTLSRDSGECITCRVYEDFTNLDVPPQPVLECKIQPICMPYRMMSK